MRPQFWQFAVPALLAAAVWVAIDRQGRTGRELVDELARQHARADEQAHLQAENQRLVAAQPTAEQLAALRARQEALDQLRAQLAALHRHEAGSAKAAAGEAKPVAGLLKGASASYLLWQDVGSATPEAAFETTLWAAVHGNIDSLAELLTFDAEARAGATATFDHLPAAVQNELGTPERLIALLTALDVPLGRASISGQTPTPAGMNVTTRLIDAEGRAKTAVFTLQTDGDRWRLLVPASVVQRYDAWLGAAAVNATVVK
jgi:hypothetical protein